MRATYRKIVECPTTVRVTSRKRRDKDGETLRSIARSYDASAATISRLA